MPSTLTFSEHDDRQTGLEIGFHGRRSIRPRISPVSVGGVKSGRKRSIPQLREVSEPSCSRVANTCLLAGRRRSDDHRALAQCTVRAVPSHEDHQPDGGTKARHTQDRLARSEARSNLAHELWSQAGRSTGHRSTRARSEASRLNVNIGCPANQAGTALTSRPAERSRRRHRHRIASTSGRGISCACLKGFE